MMKTKIVLLLIIFSILIGTSAGAFFAYTKGIPSIEEVKRYNPDLGTKIYADDDILIGELKADKGIFVPLNKIPTHVINAVIAVEDSRFWKHKGIDYIAIGRALLKDIIHIGLKEGGSTITQQLAKVMFLSPEKTLKRKVKEAILAMKIENSLSKNEILELYLNKIYFGHGAYGVEMASRIYFGKSVNNISLAEAAMIAGLIKAPNLYSPFNDFAKARERQYTVLLRMEEEGYIKKSEREMAFKQPLYLSNIRKGYEANNYFVEYVRKYLEDKYGVEKVYKGNMRVYTTLNRQAQLYASIAIQQGLRELDKRRGWRGPIEHKKDIDIEKELKTKELNTTLITNPNEISTGIVLKVDKNEALIKTRGFIGKLSIEDARWASKILNNQNGTTKYLKDFKLTDILFPGDVIKVSIKSIKGNTIRLSLEQEPQAEAALIAIEPDTGYIRALVGGYDFLRSDFNRALYAKRQPGSAFKPIIYAAALEHGFTPTTIINDEPVSYIGTSNTKWTPENADHKYYGPTTLRDALAYSRNIVTIKLLDAVGIDNVIQFARKIGIQSEMPRDLTLALGSLTLSPFELTLCYSAFANKGLRPKPIAIKYITDSKGSIIENNEPEAEEVIEPQIAFLITTMLEDVVKYGTGWRAKSLGIPVAGKTGTTNDFKDAWFIGYSTKLIATVWVGFDDMRSLGPQETGARAASPIWVNFMSNFKTENTDEFEIPEGITIYYIDPITGILSKDLTTGIKEYFKEGTEPKQAIILPSIKKLKEKETNLNFD